MENSLKKTKFVVILMNTGARMIKIMMMIKKKMVMTIMMMVIMMKTMMMVTMMKMIMMVLILMTERCFGPRRSSSARRKSVETSECSKVLILSFSEFI